MTRKTNNAGFTLIEVMLALVIAGVIVTLALIAYGQLAGQSRDFQKGSDIRRILAAIEEYRIDERTMPTELNQLSDYINEFAFYDDSGAAGVRFDALTPASTWDTNLPSSDGGFVTPTSYATIPPTSSTLGQDDIVVLEESRCADGRTPEAGNRNTVAIMYIRDNDLIGCIGN